METEKITLEVAEAEFDQFAMTWDILTNKTRMSAEDRDSFEAQKGRIVDEIMAGGAVVDEGGSTITYTLKHPSGDLKDLCFSVPKGNAYMAMDKHKERQGIHKMYEFMGAMTKQPPRLFANMDARDVKFAQGVALLFLGS